jgi:DNA repair protein RadC
MLDDLTPEPKPKPRHSGHRDRLRERAAKGGLGALPDYELLELLLFRSIPYKDVKPLAKDLLARFGGLEGIGAASHEAVEDQVARTLAYVPGKATRAVALDLQLIFDVTRRIAREPTAKRPVISSWSALLAYVRVALQHEPREQFRVLYLDKKNQLILDEVQNRGTVDHAPVYPREVVRRALELSAKSMIIVHNHPSGDPTPSEADIRGPRELTRAGQVIGYDPRLHAPDWGTRRPRPITWQEQDALLEHLPEGRSRQRGVRLGEDDVRGADVAVHHARGLQQRQRLGEEEQQTPTQPLARRRHGFPLRLVLRRSGPRLGRGQQANDGGEGHADGGDHQRAPLGHKALQPGEQRREARGADYVLQQPHHRVLKFESCKFFDFVRSHR